jgi:flagellar hook-associated protein 2
VVSLAAADQLGGQTFSSSTSALGLSGEFYVNGQKIDVTSSDTLGSIRDKINALNSGTTATGVSASILTAGPNANQLILSTPQLGAGGIQIGDGSGGVLAGLGLVDSNTTPLINANGGSSSFRFSDSATPIGTLLGASSLPAAASIQVGNTTISVNLATDSLSSIQAKMTAAGVTASLSSPTFNGQTMSELDVSAPVSAVPGDANSKAIVQLLGFETGNDAVTQSLADTSAWTDASSAPATATTALSALNVGGNSAGLTAGDTIQISGTRGDGTSVSTSLTLSGGETVQSLLDAINGSGAFGSGSRTATASINASGNLVLTDSASGSSQLGLSLVVKQSDGSTTSLGQMGVQTQGYNRQLVHGTNAQVIIGGTLVTRNTNTISDAIPGVTLNLLTAEPGQTTTLTVARDTSAATTDVQNFVSAYNSLESFVTTTTASSGALPFNMSLRASMTGLTNSLVNQVAGVTGTYQRAIDVGLNFDDAGVLSLDTDTLTAALTNDPASVQALFGTTANASTGLTYLTDSTNTLTGNYAVSVTTAAAQAIATGSGFSGTYTDSGSPDGIMISDGTSLATADIPLTTGDSLATIVNNINSAFQQQNMQLLAKSVGGQLVIGSNGYGSSSAFNISFDGASTNPTTQLGITDGSYVGTDIAGTIGGVAATGDGQTLTGATGSAVDGLVLQYTGTSPYTGSINYAQGIGTLFANTATTITDPNTGLVQSMDAGLNDEVTSLTTEASNVQTRLTTEQNSLTAQFTAMESALSTLEAQGQGLTSAIAQLQPSTG